jgi:two-component sensor histidine kinase
MAFAREVVHASAAPLLLVNDDMRVLAASEGYVHTFVDQASPEGRPVYEITGGAWNVAQVMDLLDHVRRGEPGEAVETVVICPEGLRQVRVQVARTSPPDASGPLVISIDDRTEGAAREAAREARLQEVEAFLREAQHRTANNLTMISAILSMKARGVASEETRIELEGARRRVLAMATIERHLQLDEPRKPTSVRPYIEDLCRQLSESLVGDARQIELVVEAQDGSQPRRTAVILGLVVTELVINALKYAFTHRRAGQITVEYWETSTGWCAAVSDDGPGLRRQTRHGGGLGSGIVAALALQLRAEIRTSSSPKGVRVELCCEHQPE